jgi:hypothetical protein
MLVGQGAPIVGTATVTISPAPSSANVGGVVAVTLRVNLSGVSGQAPNGSSTPAVLGGYQIAVAFDKTRLRFDSGSGGTSPGFSGVPTYTSPAAANANGSVMVVVVADLRIRADRQRHRGGSLLHDDRRGERLDDRVVLESRQRLPAGPAARGAGLHPGRRRRGDGHGHRSVHSDADADL